LANVSGEHCPALVSALSLHDALPIFDEADAAPFLGEIEQDTAARLGNRRDPTAQLVAAIAAQAGQEIAGKAFGMQPHQRRLARRSEEHTSELQSRSDLVCRLLLEKKK